MNEAQDILKKIRKIEIQTKRILSHSMAGAYHSNFKGQGVDFEEIREYTFGDDPRSIHWKTSARMNKPFIKKYKEDRELTIFLAVDLSQSLDFGSKLEFKRELAAKITSLLAFVALKNNDKVGLLLFTNTIEAFIPPQKGKNHVLRLIREVLCFKPKQKGTNMVQSLHAIHTLIKRQAIIFLISDFLDIHPGVSSTSSIFKHCSKKHDWIALILRDSHEEKFPPLGLIVLEDAETCACIQVNTSSTSFQQDYQALQTKQKNNLKKDLSANGLDYLEISTESDYALAMQHFFEKRRLKR